MLSNSYVKYIQTLTVDYISFESLKQIPTAFTFH